MDVKEALEGLKDIIIDLEDDISYLYREFESSDNPISRKANKDLLKHRYEILGLRKLDLRQMIRRSKQ